MCFVLISGFLSSKAYSPRKGAKPRTPKKNSSTVAPKKVDSEEEGDEMKTLVGISSEDTDEYDQSENGRVEERSRVKQISPSKASGAKRGQKLTSEMEQSDDQSKDVRARVSETPENVHVPGPSRSVLKDVSLVLTKPTIQQSQWFVPDFDPPRRRKVAATTGGKGKKNARLRERERGPRTSSKAPRPTASALNEPPVSNETGLASPPSPPLSPPSPSANAALESNETRVEETTRRHTVGNQVDSKAKSKQRRQPSKPVTAVASSESERSETAPGQAPVTITEKTSKPKGRRAQAPKPAPTQVATIVSSESELEGESEPAQEQTEGVVDQASSKPKRKRGRVLKPTTAQAAALASSESEFDEYLETVCPTLQSARDNGRRRKRTGGKAGQQDVVVQNYNSPSKLEQIVEELKSETRRGRRQSQRRVQPSSSSESEVKGGPNQKSSEWEKPGQKRGRSRLHVKSKPAESSSSQSDLEMDEEAARSSTLRSGRQPRDSKVASDRPGTSVIRMEEETTNWEERESGSKQGRKRLPQAAASASSESGAGESSDVTNQHTELKSRQKERQSQKSVIGQPNGSAASESDMGDVVEVEQPNRESQKNKAAAKPKRGQSRKSAVSGPPPASTTSESEVEEVVKEVEQRRRSPRKKSPGTSEDQTVSESEDRLSWTKKQKKKKESEIQCQADSKSTQHLTAEGSERPVAESEEGAQSGFSDYDVDAASPPTPPSAYNEDLSVGSKGTAGSNSKGRGEEADLTGAGEIDVSVLPRLNRRKRPRGSKVVLVPKSKKRKKNAVPQKPGVADPAISDEPVDAEVSDEPVDADVYSLSTTGEGDSFRGMEITQSAGGRRYRRLRVEPLKSHTPGVRRSNRTRIAPVRHWENEQVEYDTRRRSGY